MQKMYKCKNGHKFKMDISPSVTCPTCSEPAELVRWNTVNEFNGNTNGLGIAEELGSVIGEIPGATTALKIFTYVKVASWIKK